MSFDYANATMPDHISDTACVTLKGRGGGGNEGLGLYTSSFLYCKFQRPFLSIGQGSDDNSCFHDV